MNEFAFTDKAMTPLFRAVQKSAQLSTSQGIATLRFPSGNSPSHQGGVGISFLKGCILSALFFGLFAVQVAVAQESGAPSPTPVIVGSEPAVYRFHCDRLPELEEQIRLFQRRDPGFILTIQPDNEPHVYRLALLASDAVQREVFQILQTKTQLLPKESGRSVVRIEDGQASSSTSALPSAVPPPGAYPTPQLPQQPPARNVQSTETRDSFTPSHVELSRIEQTLRSLLGARLSEMGPARYLILVERNNLKKYVTIDIDRETNRLLIVGERTLCDQMIRLVDSIDQPDPPEGFQRRFLSYNNLRPESIQRIMDLNRPAHRPNPQAMNHRQSPNTTPQRLPVGPPIQPAVSHAKTSQHLDAQRNPVVQLVGYNFQDGDFDLGGGADPTLGAGIPPGSGMEVVSDFRYQILPDLDVIIIDATGAEVARFTDMIRQIEELSRTAEPQIEVYFLKNVYCVSLNYVIFQVYTDLFRTKQGAVRVIPMINPNAMLLVGWGKSMEAMKDLIETLDRPVATEHNMLQVLRLKHASAQHAITVLRGAFPPAPATNSAFAPRIQLYADVRTNSIIAQAGPNDLKDIERLVAEIDVPGAAPKLQVKPFKLKHTLAADLAQVLTNAITAGTTGTRDGKLPALELWVGDEKNRRMIESGIMSDVRIERHDRLNQIIVTAPDHSMPLIEELINLLDSPSATAEVKVFQILYGDANSMVKTLKSLIPTQLEGQSGPQLPGAKDEDNLVPVNLAVDTRTNSILAAGAPSDLKIIEALLYSLDREDQQSRKNYVYELKSMKADSVSTAINEYIRSKRLIQQGSPGVVSQYQQIESEVIVIPEHVSNQLIVSATPRYFDEILNLIKEIDRSPPQVVIQVLIGEVTLSDTTEFGAEFGIQESLLFGRSTFDSITESTRKITRTENGVTTVIEEPVILNGTANPGWLFNESPTTSLGNGYNSNSAQNVGNVGSQLLTNFATGRVGAETGFGGMVFSANSDAVSIMIRALQETNRLEILSRPQLTAMNNQKAFIHVGQLVPRFGGTVDNSYSSRSSVDNEKVGLMLNVVMMVAAEKSKLGSAADGVVVGISDGKEVRSQKIDKIYTMTTISAADNETVVLGGLITKDSQEIKRKVPLLGDIPLVGQLFRYDFTKCTRTELLIILTPRIVRNQADMEEVKQLEAARMRWCLGNVAQVHGDIGTYSVVADTPYTGDATVVFPEAVDMDDLTPWEEKKQPTLAPQFRQTQQTVPTPKIPTPVLPKN